MILISQLVPFRCVFLDSTIDLRWRLMFFTLDGIADFIYLIDLFIRSRTGKLEEINWNNRLF